MFCKPSDPKTVTGKLQTVTAQDDCLHGDGSIDRVLKPVVFAFYLTL